METLFLPSRKITQPTLRWFYLTVSIDRMSLPLRYAPDATLRR